MKPGTYVIYTLQFRKTHESPWCKPEEEMVEVKDNQWSGCGGRFEYSMEPWTGIGNDWCPQFAASHNEFKDVENNTGRRGWYTLEFAIKGLYRLREADKNGKFNHRDSYDKLHQTCRHEFKMVRQSIFYDVRTEEVGHADYEKWVLEQSK